MSFSINLVKGHVMRSRDEVMTLDDLFFPLVAHSGARRLPRQRGGRQTVERRSGEGSKEEEELRRRRRRRAGFGLREDVCLYLSFFVFFPSE